MPKLIKLRADYCDEFNVESFAVISDEAYPSWYNKLIKHNDAIEFYFGSSNEWLEWNNGIELFQDFNIIDISIREAELLIKLFPKSINDLGILAEFGVASGIFTDDDIFSY